MNSDNASSSLNRQVKSGGSIKDYIHGADGEVAKTLVKSLWLDPEFNNDYGRKSVKDLLVKR